ncbi:ubiquitin supergroup [Fusarium sporotrichioides]|uniref:Ubiquitin supergroup n=1 Tax=Fusarium sporotrichioides TaxID=5514 RepID=A0A395RN49_FUSSP|nr:ubiquitin supergroup [Fusarium sporotrichioides]
MKKLPFKPTALRKAAPKPSQPEDANDSNDDGLALFRRRKEMEPIMQADLDRRSKKRHAADLEEERRQLEATEEKRARDEPKDVQDSGGFSQDDSNNIQEDLPSVQPSNETPAAEQASTQDGADCARFAFLPCNSEPPVDFSSELVTPPPSKRSKLDSSSTQKPLLSLQTDDDEDEDPFPDASPTPQVRPQPDSPSPIRTRKPEFTPQPKQVVQTISIDSDSDDEVRPNRLAKRRSSSIEINDLTSTKPSKEPTPPPLAAAEDNEFAEYIRRAEENRARQQALQSANTNDSPKKEVISIMITSTIPGSGVLVAKFLFDKQLRVARDAWVKHQRKKGLDLNPDDIVLTWRRSKLYNTSTLTGLGIRPSGNGKVEADGLGSAGFRDNRSVVHIEAWTPELFQEMEQKEELQRRRDAGELSDEEEPQQEERERFIIMLKGRDIEPLECKVMPETTVDTLIAVFRKQRQIGPDKEVSLWWDGDRLEEHVEMEQAEIEEHDTIEVHVQ